MLRVWGVILVFCGVVFGASNESESRGVVEYVKEITGGLDEAKKQISALEARVIALEKKLGIKPKVIKTQEKQPSQAVRHSSSDSANVLWDKALRALFEKDFKGAESGFGKFVSNYSKEPRVPEAYYWLGEIAFLNKKTALAQQYYAKAFKALSSENKLKAEVGVKLSETCFLQNQIKKGCVFLKEVVKLQHSGCELSPATRRLLERLWQQHKCEG